jgi:hypothetical protein
MLRDSFGNNLWIMDENGGHYPVRKAQDIHQRKRGRGEPAPSCE